MSTVPNPPQQPILPDCEIRAKVSTKGQVVIPIEIRRALGLESGEANEVIFRMKEGVLYLEVAEPEVLLGADELAGLLDRPEDQGDFQLDLEAARSERTEAIIRKALRPPAEA